MNKVIEKAKAVKAQLDKREEAIKVLKSQAEAAMAKIIEAEDNGKSAEKLRVKHQKIKSDLEVAINASVKTDNNLKSVSADIVSWQIKNFDKETADREIKTAQALKDAGEAIGRATILLAALGPNGTNLGSEILSALQNHSDVCAPVIKARADFLNSNQEVPSVRAAKVVSDRIRLAIRDRSNRKSIESKYYFACKKGGFDYLEGF